MTEEQAGKASLEELKRDAFKHYEYVSAVAHYWSSLIPKAIEAYNPDLHTQFLSYLEQQIDKSDKYMQEQSYDLEAVEYCKGQKDAYLAMQEKYTQLINQP